LAAEQVDGRTATVIVKIVVTAAAAKASLAAIVFRGADTAVLPPCASATAPAATVGRRLVLAWWLSYP
jgi:hypothetical protein